MRAGIPTRFTRKVHRLWRRTVGSPIGHRKVFGIGLNKTGTTTLGTCLSQLGLQHMSCRHDLLIKLREGRFDEIFSVIDLYDSFEDWPYPLMYREIFERYGDSALFVLTTRRDARTWLNSLKAHSLLTNPVHHSRLLAYGYNYPHEDEVHHLDFYEQHNAEVREFFAARGASDRLLEVCWEHGDGWAELCAFLGLKTPDAPFPHANARRDPDPAIREANLNNITRILREGTSTDVDDRPAATANATAA